MGTDSAERSLKQALIETLHQLQNSDFNIRTQAEHKVKALEVTDEFGIHLCEVILDSNLDFAIRQLGSVLLKQYVDNHWSQEAEQFAPPECPPAAKIKIRRILPMGLKEPHNRLRSTIAYAVSTIAHFDWPRYWGELFEVLMSALKSHDPHAVDGAMRVLSEFSREISESQMLQMVPVIFPEMYSLLTSPTSSMKVKSRSVKIFASCSLMLTSMAQMDKTIAKTHLNPALPNFMKAFIDILAVPTAQTFHPGLKIEVLKSVTELARMSARSLQPFLSDILGPVWATLTDTAEVYVKNQVNNTEDIEDDIDSDGEVCGLDSLIQGIFEFVQALVESPKLRDPVRKGMEDLVYYLVIYMQLTEQQMQNWLEDPDKFVEEEDEETFAYGVRISALEVLLTLISEFSDDCVVPICGAVTRHLATASAQRQINNPYWWKLHEASMYALQNTSELMTTQFLGKRMPQQFDLSSFLATVVVEDMNMPGATTFLVGRCLCFASKFPSCMDHPVLQSFLGMTVTALQPSQTAVLRISAVRALYGFCDYLKSKGAAHFLLPHLGPSVTGLLTMADEATPEAMTLVLEAIALVISIDAEFTAMVEPKVTPLAIVVFLKHNNDNVLVSLCQDIFKELSKIQACAVQLQQRLLPTVIEILTSSKMPSSMHSVALDVLATLVRFSTPPLSEPLLTQAFPACVSYVLLTDDITCMQNGGECLRAYVYNAYPQLMQYRNDQGRNGLQLVLDVCEHLMDPKVPESAAAFVGRLVSTVVSRGMGDLGQEGIEMLLRTVLSKLLHTETCSVTQNLVLVFARLVHTDLTALLNFLSSVPGPSGESALAFVLNEWCSKQQLFFGYYDTKVTLLALTKLVEHALRENDERLLNIMVKGDEICEFSKLGARTRSQAAKNPTQWTQIPVIVKMYKIIIKELFHQTEEAWQDADESDSDEENQSPEKAAQLPRDLENVAELYRGVDLGEFEDFEEDDPEKQNDPINQIDLKKYLTQFIANIIQLPCYSTFSQHHSTYEKTALASLGFSV